MKFTLKKTLKATMLITTATLGLSSTALATGMDAFKQSISLQGLSFEEQLAKVRYFANKYANMTGEEQEIFLDEVNRTIDAKTNPDHRHQLAAAALGFETGGTQTSTLDDAVKLYEQGNYREAARIFKDYAEQGNVPVQYELGLMYYHGQGVAKDYRQAAKWWQKAAEQGHAEAQNNLGVLYKYGQGVKKNIKTAKKWFEKACNNGYQKACLK
ncbi:tetratricopeptide repeat protein [Actinobacillus porcinus]|uniref:tetratricopeptide repeat protein n=1 Tax=Actinobacillus porcinus TaxID=51048 RepID=UPI002A9110D9|nr:tetratricopeptide repeat protein [Actinobacillus porcinus]MDY6216796.1 tetratricopeptide repeat protein [Actinobacillus porcinus]